MSNPYYNGPVGIVAFTRAKAQDVNANFTAIAEGFNLIPVFGARVDGMALGYVDGQIVSIPSESATFQQEVILARAAFTELADEAAVTVGGLVTTATNQANIATTQAGIATTKAAQTEADRAFVAIAKEAVEDAEAGVALSLATIETLSAMSGTYPLAAATHVPKGLTQASVGAITAGSGGTNGTFALAWSGGNFAVNPTGTFTVSGGAVTAVTITGPGLYIGASPTVPTPSFAASSGLTGAAVALTAVNLVASGEGYWVQSADGERLIRYVNNSGTPQADAGVGSIFSAQIPTPATITESRAFVLGDFRKKVLVNIAGPGSGAVAPVILPSNSVDPLPIGFWLDIVKVGGAYVTFEADATDEANITFLGGEALLTDGDECRALKTGTNSWLVYGKDLAELPDSAYSLPFWIEPGNLTTMRQERTGASATTPVAVGDPVGSIRNLGSHGGWFIAYEDSRRPTLQQDAFGRYYLKFDGVNDFLYFEGATLSMATINFVIGYRAFSTGSSGGSGILTFGTSATGTTNRNDGAHFGLNFAASAITYRAGNPSGGGVSNPNAAGLIDKNPHVVELRQPGNGQLATLLIDEALGNQNGTANSLTNMTGKILIGCQQGNNAAGALQFSEIGLYSLLITDAELATVQRVPMREYVGSKTHDAVPHYPTMPDIAARDAARSTLITEVYGGGGIPTDIGTLATESAASIGFGGVTGVGSFQKMTLPGDYAGVAPRVMTPATGLRNDIAVLCWIGHTFQLKDYAVPAVVAQQMMDAGIRLILLAPPDGPNDYTAGDPATHDANLTPLKEWSGAASIAMNTMEDLYPGMEFYMCGISGGGWATGFCAATDDRIIGSTQFVGSLPDMIYINRDHEQRLPGLTASFLDLYLLAASNGWHNHVLYELDPAGFSRAAYNTRSIDWSVLLGAMAAALGGDYDLSWVNYNQHAFEAVSFNSQFRARLPAP